VAIGLIAAAVAATAARAQEPAFPTGPVRLVVPFGAGGLADITMRLVAAKMSERLGKQMIIDNRPGAGGIVAANAVSSSRPDGHTLLVFTNGTAISKSLFKDLPYDPLKDFAPVSLVTYFDLVVLVNGASPFRTLEDLLGAARRTPGKLNIGTINPGSTQNLSAELFRMTAALDVTIVPFRGSPDVANALLGNQVEAGMESYAALKPQIDAGALRVLANSAVTRAEYLKDVPTIAEGGVPGYEVVGWNAIVAPAATPPAIVDLLNRHINAVVAMPEIRQRMLDLGTDAKAGTPEDLRRQLTQDIAKWADVIKRAGIPQQ
jgi:tripartite-type tricarboxylate transporter receptor subunit TctC